MDIRKIKQLIEIIEDSDIAEIEIREGEESVRINRYTSILAEPIAVTMPAVPTGSAPVINLPEELAIDGLALSKHTVKSPMVGTFFRAASTTDAPFVEIRQSVFVGDTLCIIEAMKILNQIEADRDGVIKQILVDDGQPVEVGQPLFIID